MTPVYWYCFSRIITKYGEINHLQGDNGRTLCGHPIGMYWDYEKTDDLSTITCLKCRKMIEITDKNAEASE
jgi:hypothetical protein